MTSSNNERTVACACGAVELTVVGAPISCVVCHCEDCRRGSGYIESLLNAPRCRQDDGGTAYVVYRKDRVRCSKGEALLTPHKLRKGSPTSRFFAACCRSAMFLAFEDGKHWVDVYRVRFGEDAPPLEMRVCTTREQPPDANGVPSYSSFPIRFVAKLVAAKISMLFS
jgi:hypothetical protein